MFLAERNKAERAKQEQRKNKLLRLIRRVAVGTSMAMLFVCLCEFWRVESYILACQKNPAYEQTHSYPEPFIPQPVLFSVIMASMPFACLGLTSRRKKKLRADPRLSILP